MAKNYNVAVGAASALALIIAGAAQPGWQGSGPVTGNASVTASLTTQPVVTAPAPVWCEATGMSGFDVDGPAGGEVYDPQFHEIFYLWTVQGAPLAPYAAPENMATGWNNANVARGRKVAFALTAPGSYTVELFAVDSSGNIGVDTSQVTVVDADTLYPGPQTICVSNDPGETWVGEKPGCRRMSTFLEINTAVQSETLPLRVLWKRGQEWAFGDVSLLRVNSASHRLDHMGAWGSGANPIFNTPDDAYTFQISAQASNNPIRQFTCEHIEFRSDWDAETELGIDGDTPLHFLNNPEPCNYMFYDLKFDGVSALWLAAGSSTVRTVVCDVEVTNWRDYGIFMHDSPNMDLALLGTKIVQNVDAGNGAPNNEGKNLMWNDHGCFRYGDLQYVYIAVTDLFTRNGWFQNTDQPCVRMAASGFIGNGACLDRVVAEGGNTVISFTGTNSGTNENPGNWLVDAGVFMGTAMTFQGFTRAEFAGITQRNVYGVLPDVASFKTDLWAGCFYMTADNAIPANLAAPVRVHHCTFLNLQSAANDPGHTWAGYNEGAAFTNDTVENNVVHAPNINNPVNVPNLDLTGALLGITPRNKGIRYNPWGQIDLSEGSIANGVSFVVPYSEAGNDQTYWTTNLGPRSILRQGNSKQAAHRGDFTVAVEAGGLRITNTSGETWSASNQILKLDQSAQLPAIPNDQYTSPATIPAVLSTGAPVQDGGAGLFVYDSIANIGVERPGVPDQGAFQT